jgi:hypothetical protein
MCGRIEGWQTGAACKLFWETPDLQHFLLSQTA